MSIDRRHHVRAPSTAQVVLLHGDRNLGAFRVLNLSAGGVLLAGELPGGRPGGPAQGKLTAIVELPRTRSLRAEAVVARHGRVGGEAAFALTFTRISASAQDVLQSAVLRTLEQAGAATVLIVTPSVGAGLALERELGRLGRQAFSVSSPHEALRFFELRNAVHLALIDEACAGGQPSLLERLRAEQAGVRRIVMSQTLTAPPPLADELLTLPWTIDGLRRLPRVPAHASGTAATGRGGKVAGPNPNPTL